MQKLKKGDVFIATEKMGDCLEAVVGDEYLVIDACWGGGGTGHGPHDIYPDGWMIVAEHINWKNKIKFYQSGCFISELMYEDVPVVRRMRLEQRWVPEDMDNMRLEQRGKND